MELVKLRHPDLEGRELEVPPRAVAHYKRSGRVVADGEPAFEETRPAGKRAAQKGSEG